MYRLLTLFVISAWIVTGCATSQPPTGQQTAEVQSKAYYYTGDEGGSITQVDAATNTVLNRISVQGVVHNVQVTSDGKILGATLIPQMANMSANMEMNNLALFYDTATNKLLNQVKVGNHPAHIVFTNDTKYALVTNGEDNNVSVIDMNSYSLRSTISTGKGPHGLRLSTDGKFAYVANMGEDTVSVLDLVNFKELNRIKVGKTPVTTGITADGKTLLVTLNGENVVAIVDLATGSITKVPVGSGPAQLFIEPAGKYAWIANQGTEQKPSASVDRLDISGKKVVASVKTGKGAHGVVSSPDSKYIYVTNMYDDTVTVVDSQGNTAVATVKVGKTPNGISYKR